MTEENGSLASRPDEVVGADGSLNAAGLHKDGREGPAELNEQHILTGMPPIPQILQCVVTFQAVNLVGSSVYDGSKPHDADVLVRSSSSLPELERNLETQLGPKVHFLYETKGPSWDHMPLGDFVLYPVNGKPAISESSAADTLAGKLRPILVDPRYLNLVKSSGTIKFRVNSDSPDPGFFLKLQRMMGDLGQDAVGFSQKTEVGEVPVGMLYFIPYPAFQKVVVNEPDFKRFYIKKTNVEENAMLVKDFLELIEGVGLVEGTRPPWGSPGGKRFMARRLIKMFPEEFKTYVEPFFGGGAVFYAMDNQKQGRKEIINDLNKDIVRAVKFIQHISDAQIDALSKKDWKPTADHYAYLKNLKPVREVDWMYRFLYMKRHSYGGNIGQQGLKQATHTPAYFENLKRVRERLKGVDVRSEDAAKLIPKVDGKDVFFFLDPPYPEKTKNWFNLGWIEMDDLVKLAKGMKGKFLMTLQAGTKVRSAFKDFNVKSMKTYAYIITNRPGQAPAVRNETIITNYDKKNVKEAFPEKFFTITASDGITVIEQKLLTPEEMEALEFSED
jgi:DNA adenine methylase